MNRERKSRKKRIIITILSFGFIVLGIGFTSWAVYNVWMQSDFNLTFRTESAFPQKIAIVSKNIGSLTIPILKLKLPIIEGTGDDDLEKGVGHVTKSVLPGQDDNCVFAGHRETVFRQLGKLKRNDKLIVKTLDGIFTYKVTHTRIVSADDRTVIVHTDHAILTMITCYPFNTPGYFPERYIVYADLMQD